MLSGKGWFAILHTTEVSSGNPACIRHCLLLTTTAARSRSWSTQVHG